MVSIIVPLYNAGEEIARCLKSLCAQSYSDLEIIVVDDGSKDNSPQIAEEFAKRDPRIQVIHQHNSGVSVARNEGISKSSGQYLCFVDADDYVETDYVEAMLTEVKDGTVPVVNYVYNSSDERVLDFDVSEFCYTISDQFINDYFSGPLGNKIAFSACNKLFISEIVKANGIKFPTGIKLGEDMIFVFSYIAHCNRLKFIDKGLYHYSIDGSSATNGNSRSTFLQSYEDTFVALMNSEITIPDVTLQFWALYALNLSIMTPYVRNQSLRELKAFLTKVMQTNLYQYGCRCGKTGNKNREILKIVLKCKSVVLLKLTLNVYNMLKRKKRTDSQ